MGWMNQRSITSFKDGVTLVLPDWVLEEKPKHAMAIALHLLDWKIEKKKGIVTEFADSHELWDYFCEDSEDWDPADDTMYVIAKLDEKGYVDARECKILYKDVPAGGVEATTTTYYLISKRIVAKRETCGKARSDYLFDLGKWVPDEKSVLMDHLTGYDPFEPEGSPYWDGSLSVMDKVEEITVDQAHDLMAVQTADFAEFVSK